MRSAILDLAATDFKNFLINELNSADAPASVSALARVMGVDASTLNRYINTPKSHLPAYLVPFLTDDLRTTLMHYLDNKCGNPLKGRFDTSELDGSIRDECDGIVECLGELIRLERTVPGSRSKHDKTKLLQQIRDLTLKAEQEVSNRV